MSVGLLAGDDFSSVLGQNISHGEVLVVLYVTKCNGFSPFLCRYLSINPIDSRLPQRPESLANICHDQ